MVIHMERRHPHELIKDIWAHHEERNELVKKRLNGMNFDSLHDDINEHNNKFLNIIRNLYEHADHLLNRGKSENNSMMISKAKMIKNLANIYVEYHGMDMQNLRHAHTMPWEVFEKMARENEERRRNLNNEIEKILLEMTPHLIPKP